MAEDCTCGPDTYSRTGEEFHTGSLAAESSEGEIRRGGHDESEGRKAHIGTGLGFFRLGKIPSNQQRPRQLQYH